MNVRHLNRFAWFVAATAGLGASAACSKEEAPPASAASVETQTFRFAPPDGTEYVRTDKRTEEVAIVGMPLRRVEEEELKWRVGVDRKGDDYRVRQDLVFLTYTRDGQTVAKGNVEKDISAELVIDKNGNLTDVKGLDKTAESLKSLVAPGKEQEAEQIITPAALAYLIASRYKLLFGDIIGKDATPGASWTIKSPPGSFVAARTVKVIHHEPCGEATCALMQVDFQLDPQIVSQRALKMVGSRVATLGGDPSKVSMQHASYGMSGSMLVEPATMLSHGASLAEAGIVKVADPDKNEITVEIKGKTEISYSYTGAAAAARPAKAPPSRTSYR
jgi:hypothetical protein